MKHGEIPGLTSYLAKSVSIGSQHCVNVQMDGKTSNLKSYLIENIAAALLIKGLNVQRMMEYFGSH